MMLLQKRPFDVFVFDKNNASILVIVQRYFLFNFRLIVLTLVLELTPTHRTHACIRINGTILLIGIFVEPACG